MRMNEQGRSMIEMLGVLAIVGVLSVGGIAGYSKAMNKFKTNKVIDQVNMLSTNIRTLYSSQRSYAGLNNKVAIKTGVVPGEMFDAGSSGTSEITHAFAGQTYITPANQGTGTNNAYIIAIADIPASSCVSIATTDWGGDSGSGLAAIYVVNGGEAVDAASALAENTSSGNENTAIPGDNQYGLPFTIVNANQACNGESRGKENAALAWKFI